MIYRFIEGRKGGIITRLSTGKIGFPAKTSSHQPRPGEWWECEVVAEKPNYAILLPLKRYLPLEREWKFSCGHERKVKTQILVPEGEHIERKELNQLCDDCKLKKFSGYWDGGDIQLIKALAPKVALPTFKATLERNIDDQMTVISGDGFKIIASEDGVTVEGNTNSDSVRVLVELAKEMRRIILTVGHLKWYNVTLAHIKAGNRSGFPGGIPAEIIDIAQELLTIYPEELLKSCISIEELYEFWRRR